MLHSLCLCWAPKVEQQSRLDAPGGRVSAEPEGRQSMGRSAAARPLTHAALLPPGYRLQGLDLSSVLFCRTAHELERPRGFLCPFQVPLGACLTFTFCSLLVL